MNTFYAARRYEDGTLFLVDHYGAGSPEHRHEHTSRNPAPMTYTSNEDAWLGANSDSRRFNNHDSWTPVVVSEDELLELERGSA
jgi:hypothetical protein